MINTVKPFPFAPGLTLNGTEMEFEKKEMPPAHAADFQDSSKYEL